MTTNTLEAPTEFGVIRSEHARNSFQPLSDALSMLPVVSLREMNAVKLMNRIDSKYLMAASALPQLIHQLSDDYFVQSIGGMRIAKYKTLYLDTENYSYFLDHVNGKLNHIKWRIRSYVESNLNFLEIKKKSNKGRTEKERIQCATDGGWLESNELAFIAEQGTFRKELLRPVLQNCFNRITLVNRQKSERLTIDFSISFTNCLNNRSSMVSNLAIVELKQDKSVASFAAEVLAENKIKQNGISKYCLGLVLTSDQVKSNSYKQKLRNIYKITGQK